MRCSGFVYHLYGVDVGASDRAGITLCPPDATGLEMSSSHGPARKRHLTLTSTLRQGSGSHEQKALILVPFTESEVK